MLRKTLNLSVSWLLVTGFAFVAAGARADEVDPTNAKNAESANQNSASTPALSVISLPPPVVGAGENEAEKRILAALHRPLGADFSETPLKEVIAYVEDKLGVPVVIDKKGLEAVGASPDSPVSIRVANIKARSLLNLLLQPMDLTWTIRDEVLYITTPEEAGAKLITRVYDLHDLIGPGATGKPGPSLSEFIEALQGTLAPEAWDAVGGRGSLQPFGQEPILIVGQTLYVHEEIEQLLTQLRAARNK